MDSVPLVVLVADVHPEARNTGDVGAALVGFQSQHLAIEMPRLIDGVITRTNANAMMMQF
jgi:hypothetical protein